MNTQTTQTQTPKVNGVDKTQPQDMAALLAELERVKAENAALLAAKSKAPTIAGPRFKVTDNGTLFLQFRGGSSGNLLCREAADDFIANVDAMVSFVKTHRDKLLTWDAYKSPAEKAKRDARKAAKA